MAKSLKDKVTEALKARIVFIVTDTPEEYEALKTATG